MSGLMAGAYVLGALWELIPWQRRPFWSGFVVALAIGVGIIFWLRLVMAPLHTASNKKRMRG
jgi:hypothetical protein